MCPRVLKVDHPRENTKCKGLNAEPLAGGEGGVAPLSDALLTHPRHEASQLV